FLVEHTRPGDRQDAFALVWASQSLSQALGSAIAGVLPSIFACTLALDGAEGIVPLRLTLVTGAVLSALGLVPAMGLVRLPPSVGIETRVEVEVGQPRPTRSDRHLILTFGSVIFLTSLSTGFVWPFLNVYFADRLGATT